MRLSAVFAIVALAEMATFFWVQSHIGLGRALALALGTAILGSVLVRRAGLAVLRRLQARWSQGELPGRELSHAAAVLVAGGFLISPGFLTDIAGFLLLVPGVRDVVHGFVSKRLTGKVRTYSSGFTVIDVDEVD